MRIDKYLWCVRVFKTRSIAVGACKGGLIKINGKNCKPSREIYPGEVVVVRKNQLNLTIEVLSIPKSRVAAKLVHQFCKDMSPKETIEKRSPSKYTQNYDRKKGTGRPTKKDRRAIDNYQTASD